MTRALFIRTVGTFTDISIGGRENIEKQRRLYDPLIDRDSLYPSLETLGRNSKALAYTDPTLEVTFQYHIKVINRRVVRVEVDSIQEERRRATVRWTPEDGVSVIPNPRLLN